MHILSVALVIKYIFYQWEIYFLTLILIQGYIQLIYN
jgi:hypothetical protein